MRSITSGVRFFEKAHVKDVCSCLRLLATPGDEMAFARFVRLLPGVGEQTALRLWDKLGCSFALRKPDARGALGALMKPRSAASWQKIAGVFGTEEFPAEFSGRDAAALLAHFVDGFYATHAEGVFEDALERLNDVGAVVDDLSRAPSLASYLSDMALLTNIDGEVGPDAGNDGESLRLSTIHQAKGLEWPVVFVLWVNEGMFPSTRSIADSDDGDEEERRLFYVATTRAADLLCYCAPELRRTREGGTMFCPTSRFIDEIPGNLLGLERATVSHGIF